VTIKCFIYLLIYLFVSLFNDGMLAAEVMLHQMRCI